MSESTDDDLLVEPEIEFKIPTEIMRKEKRERDRVQTRATKARAKKEKLNKNLDLHDIEPEFSDEIDIY